MGDLLVTIVGANTGDVGPVNEDRPQHYVCQSVALMRPRNIAVTPFLNLWFSSLRHGRKYLMECAYGAGRPHLSFVHLKNAPIALPSQEEQDEIVRRVGALEALADHVLACIDKATRSLSDCASTTIQTAFSGRATQLLPVAASEGD
jgi:type I restriction enzyme S subunit